MDSNVSIVNSPKVHCDSKFATTVQVQPSLRNTNMEVFNGIRDRAQNFDVVSLGDVVTDEFIRLPEGAVHVRVDDDGRWLEIRWARSSSSKMTHCRLPAAAPRTRRWRWRDWGYEWPGSYLAHDQIGLDMLSAMRGEDVDTSLIHVDSPSHTVRNFVLTLGASGPSSCATPTSTTSGRVSETTKFQPGCTSTPSARRAGVPRRTRRLVGQFPNVRLAFQPGTFQLEAVPNDSLVFTPEPNCSSAAVPPPISSLVLLERLEAPSR